MINLQKLTPAEVLLFLREAFLPITLADHYKVTCTDLLIRKVLVVQKKKKEGKEYFVIAGGEKIENYKAKLHEKQFIAPFKRERGLTLSVPALIKYVNLKKSDPIRYCWDYLVEPELKEYFQKPFLSFLKYSFAPNLNRKGKALKEEIKAQLAVYTKKIEEKTLTAEELHELCMAIGTNYILLDNFDSSYFRSILATEPKVKEEAFKHRRENNTDDFCIFSIFLSNSEYDDSEVDLWDFVEDVGNGIGSLIEFLDSSGSSDDDSASPWPWSDDSGDDDDSDFDFNDFLNTEDSDW